MILTLGAAPGAFDARRRRPRRDFAGVRALRSYGAPADPCAAQIAALQQQLAIANAKLAAVQPIIAQLKAIVTQVMAQQPTPAAEQVVDVTPTDCATSAEPEQVDAVDRAWFGDHLRGDDLRAYGGEDFGDLDADLGLDG